MLENQISKYFQKFLNVGDFESIEKESVKFLKQYPNNLVLINYLGFAQLKLNKINLAIESFKRGIALAGGKSFEINLANAYFVNKQKLSANKLFLKIFNEDKINIDILKYLYSLYLKENNKRKIFNIFIEKIEQFMPDINDQFFDFILFFIHKNEYDFSKQICLKILKYYKHYLIYNFLGKIFYLEDNFDDAERYFNLSINQNINNYSSYFDLAELYKSKGEIDLSIQFYNKAITLNNLSKKIDWDLHRCLSLSKKYNSEDDEHFIFMKGNLKNNNQDPHLLYALAKAYEDLKNYKSSFECFDVANQLMFKRTKFNFDSIKKEFEIIKNFFIKNDFNSFLKYGYYPSNPIFIVGLPRSGSTLVEQIISSHSQVDSLGESKIFGRNLGNIFNNYSLQTFEKSFSKIIFNKDLITLIGKLYHEKSITKIKKKYFTDKMLFNFIYLGLISISLPKSKIIICNRDYKDIFLSIYKNFFTEQLMSFSNDKETLLNYIFFYDDVIKFWKSKLNKKLYFVDYEQLVKNPDYEIKNIINYCDLDWEENCLKFYDNKQNVKTLSSIQVRNKIYTSSSNLWSKYEPFLKLYFDKINLLQNWINW